MAKVLSQDIFLTVVDSVPESLLIVNSDEEILFANKATALWGYSPEELIGTPLSLFLEKTKGEIGRSAFIFNGENYAVLSIKKRVDNSPFTSLSVDDAFAKALQLICTRMQWQVGHVFKVDPDSGFMAPTTIWFLSDPKKFQSFTYLTEQMTYAEGIGLPGRILSSKQPEVIENIYKDRNYQRAQLCQDTGVVGAFGFPIVVQGKVLAVLEFYKEEEMHLTEEQIKHLVESCMELEICLKNESAQRAADKSRALALEAISAKGEFFKEVDHEIRAPLNAIIGMSDLLEQTQLSEEQQEYVTNLRKNGAHLLNLIQEILDLYKIESGIHELKAQLFDVRTVIKVIETKLLPLAQERNSTVKMHISSSLSSPAFGDCEHIERILSMLLETILKQTLRIELYMRVSRDREMLKFAITQKGAAPEILEEIVKAQHLNLSLHTIEQLLKFVGGEMEIKAAVDKEQEIVCTIPVKMKQGSQSKKETLSLLLIEDTHADQVLIRAYLKTINSTLVTAPSQSEALKKCNEEGFDIILIDIDIPRMNPAETIYSLRTWETKMGQANAIPIIILTSFPQGEETKKCIDAGANIVLPKPIKKHTLLEAISHYCQNIVD
ncbi:MAG: histidine kinase dimerization/phospho-acceptor domain-containing protein [Chlamydiales bacterium]